MKYRFAEGRDARIVDVIDLTSETRSTEGPFLCLGCGQPLVPKIGTLGRQKHFAHKPHAVCSRETYLHESAKRAFLETYLAAVQSGKPYTITFTVPVRCTAFEGSTGFTCPGTTKRTVDLVEYFPHARLEATVGEFRPDVVLENKARDKRVFIEIAVTHEASQHKIESAERIVEIAVSSEDDIEYIRRGALVENSVRVKLFNFKRQEVRDNVCGGACTSEVEAFIVYASGKSILNNWPMDEWANLVRRAPIVHKQVFGVRAADLGQVRGEPIDELSEKAIDYRVLVQEASLAGVSVSNCYLCRYHGLDGVNAAIFCKVLKQTVPSHHSHECGKYTQVTKREELNAINSRNDAYLKEHGPGRLKRFLRHMVRGPLGY